MRFFEITQRIWKRQENVRKAKKALAGRPKAFGYDGYDRDLTEEQKAAFRAEGRKPALRIRMPDSSL